MLALALMLAAFTQAPVAPPNQGAGSAPVPNVEVVGPTRQNRVICRTIIPSGSHIAARRVCQTQAQRDEQVDRAQTEASLAVAATDRLTEGMLESSGYMRGAGRPLDTSRPPPPPR